MRVNVRSEFRPMILRHKFTVQHAVAGLALLAATAFFAWQLRVFVSLPDETQKLLVEIDEVMFIVTLGFGLFAWSRMKAQRREMTRRVAAEMRRWGVAIDDSAGRPLAHTAAGAFLCLLVEAAETQFAPVPEEPCSL